MSAPVYAVWPPEGVQTYPSAAQFPTLSFNGALAVALDTYTLYVFEVGPSSWVPIATPGAAIAIDALTGDVQATGPGAVAATIQPNVVTNSKLAQMPANTIKGNNTGSTANALDLTVAQVSTMLSLSGTNTGDQTITLTGDVTGSGTGSFAATVITNANLTGPITSVGNATSIASQTGTGSTFVMSASPSLTSPNLDTPTALVGTNITGTAAGLTAGTVTTNANLTGPITSVGNATAVASQTGTGSTFVMSVSPTLTTPNLGTPSALVGTNITGTAAGLTVGAVSANAVTNAMLAQMPTLTIKGNNTAGTANALDLTVAQVNSMLGQAINSSAKVANYQILVSDSTIEVNNTSSGPFTVTMPSPATAIGQTFHIINMGNGGVTSNLITIAANSGEKFGAGALTALHLSTSGESYALKSDGTNWMVVSHFDATSWVQYSPTVGAVTTPPTPGSGTTIVAYWKRTGGSMIIRYELNQTSATGANVGSGTYLWPLPAGYAINTSLISASTNTATTNVGLSSVGSGMIASTLATHTLNASVYNTTNIVLSDSTPEFVGSSVANFTSASFRLSFYTTQIPITNWEA